MRQLLPSTISTSLEKEFLLAKIDSVILLTGKIQNDSLFAPFKGLITETYLAGDANLGGARIGNAIFDGNKIGRLL